MCTRSNFFARDGARLPLFSLPLLLVLQGCAPVQVESETALPVEPLGPETTRDESREEEGMVTGIGGSQEGDRETLPAGEDIDDEALVVVGYGGDADAGDVRDEPTSPADSGGDTPQANEQDPGWRRAYVQFSGDTTLDVNVPAHFRLVVARDANLLQAASQDADGRFVSAPRELLVSDAPSARLVVSRPEHFDIQPAEWVQGPKGLLGGAATFAWELTSLQPAAYAASIDLFSEVDGIENSHAAFRAEFMAAGQAFVQRAPSHASDSPLPSPVDDVVADSDDGTPGWADRLLGWLIGTIGTVLVAYLTAWAGLAAKRHWSGRDKESA